MCSKEEMDDKWVVKRKLQLNGQYNGKLEINGNKEEMREKWIVKLGNGR